MRTVLPKIPPRTQRAPLTRSEMMSRIRSQDTQPELRTRSAVHSLGLRFRKHVSDLPGRPDLANKTRKWAIFVHGCFWHHHLGCKLASTPKSNQTFWSEKLARNEARDIEKIAGLIALGFDVLVLWECDVREDTRLRNSLVDFFDRRPGQKVSA